MFKTSSQHAYGLPLPAAPSSKPPAPSGKRSRKNLFASKRSRRPTAALEAAAGDLDFGCPGLRMEDEDEDILLEIRAATIPPPAPVSPVRREYKYTFVQDPHQVNIAPTDTNPAASLSSKCSSSNHAAASPSSTSARSSASYTAGSTCTTLESSFCSTASPSAASSSTCPSSNIALLPTPSRSASSSSSSCVDPLCLLADAVPGLAISNDAQSNPPLLAQGSISEYTSNGWNQSDLRRKQEEQAAIEALDAYFAVQDAEKKKAAALHVQLQLSPIVEGRRASEPLNARRRSRTVTDAQGQGRRGSEPTLTLRMKRIQGSLRNAAAMTGQHGNPAAYLYAGAGPFDDGKAQAAPAFGLPSTSTESGVGRMDQSSLSRQGLLSQSSHDDPIRPFRPPRSEARPSHAFLPAPAGQASRLLSSSAQPPPIASFAPSGMARRPRSSTTGGLPLSRPMAVYHIDQSQPQPQEEAGILPAPSRPPQRRHRSSSYFSTYYGREYTGRVLGQGEARAQAPAQHDKVQAVAVLPTLPMAARTGNFIDMQSPVDLAFGPAAHV